MSYLDEAFKDLHELEDGVDLQDEQEVKDAIEFMNGDKDNLAQLELIVDADADSEEDIKDTYVGELLLYCPVCHTIHYEKEENIVFDEENDEIVNVGDACPHCKQENGYEIVGKVEEYDATEDEPEEENEPTEDDDVPLELDDIEDFEDEETTKKVEESFKIRKRLKEHFEEDNLEELARFTGERLHTRERVRETKKVEPKKVEPKQSLKESKTPKKESKLVEKPVYGLEPRYDARKSFYGKAQVDTGDKGDKNKLYSYDTLVAEIKDDKPVVYGTYSQTTLRHIKEWLKQLGFKAENSKQILSDYGAKKESCKEAKEEALGKIQEITKAVDCDGNEFYVKPIWKTDRLATLVDKDGNQTRVLVGDLRQFYDLYDQDDEVISHYEDYFDESCKEAKKTNESLKEHISSKDLKDNDILDILGIEEEQRKVKNVGSYIKQYRQLLDKGYDEPKFEIYLKGDDAYYKKLGKVVDNSKDLVVIDTNSKDESLKEGFRGCKKVEMIWHGSQSDPELSYTDENGNEYRANYWDIEDGMYEYYKEEHDYATTNDDEYAKSLNATYDWSSLDGNSGDDFDKFVMNHEDDVINDIIEYNSVDESCGKDKKRTKQNVKEGYYDYMDKDYAHILDSNVDVYDVNAYILKDSNNKFKAHYTDEYAIIVTPNGKGCAVDYEAVGQDFDSVDSKIEFGVVENKDDEYTDEKGNKYKTISMIATHRLNTTPKEIMENAPKKTMKYKDFFKKYKYNDRCASNFRELVSYLQSNGAFKGEKVTESKKRLNEGPGAGYSVKGTVTNIHNVQVVSDVESKSEYFSNTVTATAECDIIDVNASSYYYGRDIVGGSPIPAKLEIKLDYDKDEFNNGATQVVEALGDDFEFDAGIGGGWVHSTFDGVIEGDYHDVENSPYSTDILNFTITIENKNVIEDIDKAVTGEDWVDNYDVIDTDGDIIDSFETEDEAIDFAKKNRGVAVEHRQYQYALMDDFESEDIIDEYSDGTVWEREYTKSYKYDDEPQEEALDTKKVPPVITDEQKACKDEECKKKELDESLIVTCDFDDYKPWSGAIANYEKIEEEGKLDELEALLEECYPEGISMVGINDILWFDWEWVFEELGINENYDEEEDEDEEDFDESLFESLVDRYCQRVYDNVRDFKTTSCSKKEKNFVVEGILHYTNGKKAKTTFTFKEAKAPNGKRKFVGLNETFSKDNKAFTLLVSTGDKKLLSESLSYKYNVEYKGEQKEIKGKIVTPKH